MSAGARHEAAKEMPIATAMVRVDHDGRRGWQVALPNGDRITCRTFDQARREAYVSAPRTERCELIVHDAYHRVLSRELVKLILGDRRPIRTRDIAGHRTQRDKHLSKQSARHPVRSRAPAAAGRPRGRPRAARATELGRRNRRAARRAR